MVRQDISYTLDGNLIEETTHNHAGNEQVEIRQIKKCTTRRTIQHLPT